MSESSSERTAAERITFLASLAVLVAILLLALWAGMRTGDGEPVIAIDIHLDQMSSDESGFYVPVTVTNTGGETAQDVVITGELDIKEDQPEFAEATFNFLAGGESEQAVLIFSTDPTSGVLIVRPTSFVVP